MPTAPEVPALQETLACAEAAQDYARKLILYGSTQIENNLLRRDPSLPRTVDIEHLTYVENLAEGVLKLEDYIAEQISEKRSVNSLENKFLITYETYVALTTKFSLGNCTELALEALDFILNNHPEMSAEIFTIAGGDHVFVVLNRHEGSDPHNPMTWGDSAVICDPWAEDKSSRVYPATEYRKHLKSYVHDIKNKQNTTEELELETKNSSTPPKHVLTPNDIFNTTMLRKLKKIHELSKAFDEQVESLTVILAKYRTGLETEIQRLKDERSEKKPTEQKKIDHKITVLRNKADQIQAQFHSTHDTANAVREMKFANYDEAKSVLTEHIATLKEEAIHSMQFMNKEDRNILGLTPGFLGKVGIFNKTNPTKIHLQEVVDDVNADLAKLYKGPRSV